MPPISSRNSKATKLGLPRILASQAAPGQAERVQLSLEALSFLAKAEAPQPGPKVVLWISPGWPFLAKFDARSSEQLFDSIIYFTDLLRSARILLYAIDPQGVTAQDHAGETEGSFLASRPGGIRANRSAPNVPAERTGGYYKQFLKSPRDASESNPNDLTLQVMAIGSGGRVLQLNNDLRSQIEQCFSDAKHISTLSYEPTGAFGAAPFHAIQVRRSADAQILRSQTGYYAR